MMDVILDIISWTYGPGKYQKSRMRHHPIGWSETLWYGFVIAEKDFTYFNKGEIFVPQDGEKTR